MWLHILSLPILAVLHKSFNLPETWFSHICNGNSSCSAYLWLIVKVKWNVSLPLRQSESPDSSGISLLTTILPLSRVVDLFFLYNPQDPEKLWVYHREVTWLCLPSLPRYQLKEKMLRKTRQPLFHPARNCWYIIASVTWSSALATDIPVLHLQSRQNEREKIASNRRERVDFSITRPRIRTLLSSRKEMIERFWKLR